MRSERKSNAVLLWTLIAALLFFAVLEPSYGWKLRAWLTPSNIAEQGSSDPAFAGNLVAQNESLKAQLAELQTVASELPASSPQFLRAMVYSRYPLNFKNELTVNAGSRDGVAAGAAVIFQGMFIGRVLGVGNDYATVQTVFDNGFRMPVRVGTQGYDGLLTGGSYPYVASIVKNSSLAANDVVYTAASGIPYALPIGEVQSTSTSADSLFSQAALVFPYDINHIQAVMIVK